MLRLYNHYLILNQMKRTNMDGTVVGYNLCETLEGGKDRDNILGKEDNVYQ